MGAVFLAEECTFNLWKLKPEPHIAAAPESVRLTEVPCRRIKVMRDGELAAVYVLPVSSWINYAYAWRPYIYPFYSPRGLALIQHNPPDHLHHRGIWIAHGEVDGHEVFVEQEDAGRIAPRHTEVTAQGEHVVIEQHNQWLDYMGTPLLDEDRRIRFHGDGDANIVDHEVVLRAPGDRPVVIGATIHGFLGVRTDDRLEIRNGGRIVNADGVTGADANGQVSRWIDAHGTIGGHRCGIAVYNYPQNPVQPMIASHFGWIAAHPFWREACTLQPGAERRLGFRVVGHDGWPGDLELDKYCP